MFFDYFLRTKRINSLIFRFETVVLVAIVISRLLIFTAIIISGLFIFHAIDYSWNSSLPGVTPCLGTPCTAALEKAI